MMCLVASPSFTIMISLWILGAIVTSDDVVTAVVTPPVLIDLMKAKIMFRLFCHNQIDVTHLLVRFVQVRRSPRVEIQHKVIQFDTFYLSLKQCILYYLNNYTQI